MKIAMSLFFAIALQVSSFGQTVVAVVPFQWTGRSGPANYTHGLPDMVSGNLANLEGLRVVDRVHISEAIQEFRLAQAGITGPEALQMGNWLQADIVVVGTVMKQGQDLSVQVKGIRIATGEIAFGAEKTGPVKGLVELNALGKNLANQIATRLIPGFTEDRISDDPGFTDSDKAFDQYSRGIRDLDEGKKDKALDLLEGACRTDGTFEWARLVSERARQAFQELDDELEKLKKK